MFVLGAGFSIAASGALGAGEGFPDTAELGNRALTCLDEARRAEAMAAGFPTSDSSPGGSGQFEAWLARLAEDQPYLSTEENLRNRALYVAFVAAVRQVLVGCEEHVGGATVPWMSDLLSVWHASRAQVITLNYDTLVERCLARLLLSDTSDGHQVSVGDLLDGIPQGLAGEGLPTGVGAATFRLVKLHGSTSWFWVPGDATGTTVMRLDPPSDTSEADTEVQAERSRLLLGREPFIVPPVTSKASLYASPVTKALWTRARGALRDAGRVVIVGYSLATLDVTATGLLAETLAGRSDVQVEVVDPDAQGVSDRLGAVGVRVSERHSGGDCVEQFVTKYVDEATRRVVTHLGKWKPDCRNGIVRIGWGNPNSPDQPWRSIVVEVDNERRVLVVKPDDNGHTTLEEFLGSIEHVERIVVDGKEQHAVVDWVPTAEMRVSGGDPRVETWFVNLHPAGRPSS